MGRRKDWEELSPRTSTLYKRILERVYGKRVPSAPPDFAALPESSRATLRAALQAYWAARDDEARGIVLAKKVKKTRVVHRQAVWPSMEDAEVFLKAAADVAPRSAYLLVKFCMRRGLRSEEVLSTPRAAWESALRYGKLKFVGKGNKERTLVVDNMRGTIRELLDTPGNLPHDKSEAEKYSRAPAWKVPGELLARPGSTFGTQHNLFARYIKKVAKVAGLDPAQWKPHALRHVFSDRYMNDGGTERGLQVALGHASLETITRYTHPTPEGVGKHFRGD